MSIYCWGNTAHGELGIGGIEDEQVILCIFKIFFKSLSRFINCKKINKIVNFVEKLLEVLILNILFFLYCIY